MPLPRWVFKVRRYWYYQHRRGRPDHGPLIRLPEYGTPEFWAKMAEIEGQNTGGRPGTFAALIVEYKAHSDYTSLSAGSRRTYEHSLNAISRIWGGFRVDGLVAADIQLWMDTEFQSRPAMGNLTLSVLKGLLQFGATRRYCKTNAARELKPLRAKQDGAKPWPQAIWEHMVRTGPPELSRLAVLGRATGQRVSDLMTMRPEDRDGDGIYHNIQKRGILDKSHWCPLAIEYRTVIDSWKVFPRATYIATEKGRQFNYPALAARFDRFVAGDENLKDSGIGIHGLRCMAVCDRRIAGDTHQQIEAAIGMSLDQVMHYSRDVDQRLVAESREREQNKSVKTRRSGVKTPKPK